VTIVVVVLLALAGASCGGGDDEASDTDTVVTETTTDETTTDETTEETTTDDTDTEVGGFLAGECRELIDASQALGQAFSAAGSEADLEESTEAFEAFANEAPEEVRADLQIMAEVFREYVDAIRDSGIEEGETPSQEQALALQQALASIDLEEFTAASTRFNAWAADNC